MARRQKKEEKPKRKVGRPELDLNPNMVIGLARMECTVYEIAGALGCSSKTLQKEKWKELIHQGRMQGNVSLRKKQYDLALKGNVTMLIWLGKNRLGQKDQTPLVLNPEGMTPPQYQIVFVNKFVGPDGKEKLLPMPQIETNPFGAENNPPINVESQAVAGD